MSDETKLIEATARARRAQEWLDNQLYKEAWEALRSAALTKLEELPLQDEAGRTEIHHMLSVMKKVRSYIQRAVEDGKFAQLELGHKKSFLKRVF